MELVILFLGILFASILIVKYFIDYGGSMKKTPSQVINDNYKAGEILKEGMEDNKKMRVIDLLNKIANGEMVKFIYKDNRFAVSSGLQIHNDTCGNWVDINIDRDIPISVNYAFLNDDIEIIEEDLEDEEIVEWSNTAINEMKKAKNLSEIKAYIETIMRTQNEIIEKIKTLD